MVYIGERVRKVWAYKAYEVFKGRDADGVWYEVVCDGVILGSFKKFGDAKAWCAGCLM